MVVVMFFSLTQVVMTEELYLEVEHFDGIDIGTGIVTNAKCDTKNTVTLLGDKRDLKIMEVEVINGTLDISRQNTKNILKKIFGKDRDNSIEAEITIDGQLAEINGSTGSSISVPGCAVDNSHIQVDMSTGSVASIEGKTASIELALSTGGFVASSYSGSNKSHFLSLLFCQGIEQLSGSF